jgi:hypothetical protein
MRPVRPGARNSGKDAHPSVHTQAKRGDFSRSETAFTGKLAQTHEIVSHNETLENRMV